MVRKEKVSDVVKEVASHLAERFGEEEYENWWIEEVRKWYKTLRGEDHSRDEAIQILKSYLN